MQIYAFILNLVSLYAAFSKELTIIRCRGVPWHAKKWCFLLVLFKKSIIFANDSIPFPQMVWI